MSDESHESIDQEALDKLEAMRGQLQETVDESGVPEKQGEVFPLDIEDQLRLENMMLKESQSKMAIQLANMSAKEARDVFQRHILAKHGIDPTMFTFQIDPGDKTLIISPK